MQSDAPLSVPPSPAHPSSRLFTIVVLGASGDLAKKKTFPAIFSLFKNQLLPPNAVIVGYARTALTRDEFLARISPSLKLSPDDPPDIKSQFLANCDYVSGQYDDLPSFQRLQSVLQSKEQERGLGVSTTDFMRIFYMALPPSVFATAGQLLKSACFAPKSVNRVILEKPFGKDLATAQDLLNDLSKIFKEEEVRALSRS